MRVEETTEAVPGGGCREYRKGMKYNMMRASRVILHKSDRSRLPEGSEIIRSFVKRYSYEEVVEFIEHDVEMLVYKTVDGKVVTAYLPKEGDNACQGESCQFPGTHATSSLLSYIAFNKYQMSTPLYRELTRFLNHDMHVSDGTLSNWLKKGSVYLKELIPFLKDIALVKDSFVNCDETWCRVRRFDHYSKRYIWCLVSKSAKTVIFMYDDGSRGRKVLRDILEDREIAALQSDAYNVYMFIDKELDNVTHLCCMAHARAKFKEALFILFHTFISTCSMMGISAQKYFKMFFNAIIEGRRDYANLLPMTIGIQ